jgi:hypothetical protein
LKEACLDTLQSFYVDLCLWERRVHVSGANW